MQATKKRKKEMMTRNCSKVAMQRHRGALCPPAREPDLNPSTQWVQKFGTGEEGEEVVWGPRAQTQHAGAT